MVRLKYGSYVKSDAVVYLWLENLDPAQLQIAASLYNKNCAACHGETGNGEGPGADVLAGQKVGQQHPMTMAAGPTAFAEPSSLLGGTSDIYYAKIRRGGMGTGMPSFGPLFTPAETWLLVDYLWMFVFAADGEG